MIGDTPLVFQDWAEGVLLSSQLQRFHLNGLSFSPFEKLPAIAMLEVKCVRKRRPNQRTYELRGEVRRGELLILVFPNCDTGNQEEDDANRNDNIKNF